MRWALCLLLLGAAVPAPATADEPGVTLSRLDCGRTAKPMPLDMFDDAGGQVGKSGALAVSCYLVRHGERAMIWDTGFDITINDAPDGIFALDRTLVDQLAQVGLSAQDVDFVGISHYHGDHVGQTGYFPNATLLIGAGDWDAISQAKEGDGIDRKPFTRWLEGGGEVIAATGDHDVFGDGRVRLIATPGHTPGHRSLLVQLSDRGTILLTGDLAHFSHNYAHDNVPTFNTDRADTLASFDRFKKMAANLDATVIIQHEPADVDKLPVFPEAAR